MHYSYSLMTIRSETQLSATPKWTLSTALQLGRVSNLPTVWTNTLAAIVISGGTSTAAQLVGLLLAMSLAYTGGMYLNDAFDRQIDFKERPERPIPAGKVLTRDVLIAGYGMLLASLAIVSLVSGGTSGNNIALLSAAGLVSAIIAYNLWHKGNPFSPLLMGICRMLVYITCALAITQSLSFLVVAAALMSCSYLIGLSYTAKQEKSGYLASLWPMAFLFSPLSAGLVVGSYSLPSVLALLIVIGWILYCLRLITRKRQGDISCAVVRLIAGISLLDALLIAISADQGSHSALPILPAMAFCYLAFCLSLYLQRYISGT
jgi:hypothetical protein